MWNSFLRPLRLLFLSSVLCVSCQAMTQQKTITILFTNDVESAYDPIDAFWLDDIETIGGVAQMSTLITNIREQQPNVFLFDAGDIFTGALAKLTEGRLSFELMISMGYDAMAIGNHEFEFGHQVIEWQKNRAPFPVLGANMFYKGTDHPFAQAHTIIERNGIRIGVIGIMGQDAATAIIPSYVAAVDVRDPVEYVKRSVNELRYDVDLIVLLTHQGKTAPMQTDAETDPRLQRDIDADINLAGAVEGVDVLLAGHADAGTPEPVVHPKTGTLIMQTYGQATHLGYLQLTVGATDRKVKSYDGKLVAVDAKSLKPDPVIVKKLEQYRAAYPELFEVVGETKVALNRRYIEESSVGNLFADIILQVSNSDVALIHSGSLRKDLPKGTIRRVDLLDTYPFVDSVEKVQLSGQHLREALEQSLSFERGILQVSGIKVQYDLQHPIGSRLISVKHKGAEIKSDQLLTVSMATFLAEGGDLYTSLPKGKHLQTFGKISAEIIDYFKQHSPINMPAGNRQIAKK